MNDGHARFRLGPEEASLVINGTTRGDYLTGRPGWRRIMTALAQPPGFYQHAGWFRSDTGQVFLIIVCAGRFFRIDPLARTVLEITIPGDPNPSTFIQGWSAQGETWWLYNDGQTRTFIFNGSSARRSTVKELQPGTVLAHVQGRIWYSLPDGLSFRATDLVGNKDSGTPAYNYRDSILRETENTYLNEGGNFSVPNDSGAIRAMRATAILDTSQGQGPLQVLCDANGFSVNTPVDRTIWKSVTYPIQTESLIGSGASGAQNTVNVNGDLFFRSPDGIRSFIIARRQFRDWGNTPQSFEVSGILDADQADLLHYGSTVVYDNRLLMTCSPVFSQSGIYHRGLVAMDLSPIASLQSQAPPVYDGIWTGLNILTILQTSIGVYATVLAPDRSIEIWKLSKKDLYDNGGRITTTIVPRQLYVERDVAGRPSRTLKKLQTAELEYDQISGEVDYKMLWAPDSYPCYNEWHSWSECVQSCSQTPGCVPSLNFQTGYQPRKRLPEPPDICATGAKRPLRNFYSLNVRLDITGPSRILGVRVGSSIEAEPKYEANACDAPLCVPITCCNGVGNNLNPFTYVSPGQGVPSIYGSGSGGGSGGGGGGGGGGGTTVTSPPNTDGGGNVNTNPDPKPDLPPHTIVPPSPNPTPIVGGGFFYGLWTDPGPPNVHGNDHEVGRPLEPPLGLEPGVYEAWAQSLWTQFAAYVSTNNITVTQAQIMTVFVGGDPPSSDRRYDANQVFVNGFYTSAYGLGWVLGINWV